MTPAATDDSIDIAAHLHLDTGLKADERAVITAALEPLTDLLRSLDRESLKIDAWIKNRGERGQITYVSIHAKDTDIVASDDADEIRTSLANIRRDLKRQLADLHDRRTTRRH